MDLDLFDNITENSTFNPEENYAIYVYDYLQIPSALVSLLSSIINALIIFTIIRYRVLHTRLYFYLANWCACNFIITISAHQNLNVLGYSEIVSATVLCIWWDVAFSFMAGNLMFVAALLLDWYIMTFANQNYCAINCRRHYKLIAAAIWVLVVILLIKSILYCLDFIVLPLVILLTVACYFLVSLLILIIFILRVVKLRVSSIVVEKSTLELKLVISHFLCWLPNIIFLLFHIKFQLSTELEYICYIVWYSNACVIFLILYFQDEHFRKCINVQFNIKCNFPQNENKDVPLITII